VDPRPLDAAEDALGSNAEMLEAPSGGVVPGPGVGGHGLAPDQLPLTPMATELERAHALEHGAIELWQLVGRGDAFHP